MEYFFRVVSLWSVLCFLGKQAKPKKAMVVGGLDGLIRIIIS